MTSFISKSGSKRSELTFLTKVFSKISFSDEIDVTQYPTFVLFHNGKLCQYCGELSSNGLVTFLKESVQEDDFICLDPHYYNDEQETDCLPFLKDA